MPKRLESIFHGFGHTCPKMTACHRHIKCMGCRMIECDSPFARFPFRKTQIPTDRAYTFIMTGRIMGFLFVFA